jgi:gamma-glutamylaminecyclotransferase
MLHIFVYGTLMRGERNHGVLAGATYVHSTCTAAGRTMVDLGPYPALLPADDERDAGRAPVHGEVWVVSEAHAARLDAFEGRAYRREEIELARGRAVTYVWAARVPRRARVVAEWRRARDAEAGERS